MAKFFEGIEVTGYFFYLLKVTQILCGLALLSGRFVPLALVVLAPIVLDIFLVHAFLTREGLVVAVALGVDDDDAVDDQRRGREPSDRARSRRTPLTLMNKETTRDGHDSHASLPNLPSILASVFFEFDHPCGITLEQLRNFIVDVGIAEHLLLDWRVLFADVSKESCGVAQEPYRKIDVTCLRHARTLPAPMSAIQLSLIRWITRSVANPGGPPYIPVSTKGASGNGESELPQVSRIR